MDNKQVVDNVCNDKSDFSEYGSIIAECRTILVSCNNFRVVFTRRHANDSAHALAKASTTYASCTIFDHIPNCIWNIVMNESSWFCVKKQLSKMYIYIFQLQNVFFC